VNRIEDDTVLIPLVVAETVVEEVYVFTGRRLSGNVANDLANKANAIYNVNTKFRKRIRRHNGREVLFSFMRHWLAACLKRQAPKMFALLPASFLNGAGM
jgi:hypothetical protein